MVSPVTGIIVRNVYTFGHCHCDTMVWWPEGLQGAAGYNGLHVLWVWDVDGVVGSTAAAEVTWCDNVCVWGRGKRHSVL
jgi:hypothetical protein